MQRPSLGAEVADSGTPRNYYRGLKNYLYYFGAIGVPYG